MTAKELSKHPPSPGRRTQLVMLALSMESMFAVIAFLPLTPVVVLTAMFYSSTVAVTAGVVLFAGCWYLLQPDFGLDGWFRDVQKTDPVWREVRDLCQTLDAPLPHRIVVCDEFNAFAHTHGGVLALIGVKRTLGLGIPLLRLLNLDEARAVIAHELGHFSRRHDRLGHWIYRVRCKWLGYAYASRDDEGFVDGAVATIAERVVPGFLTRSAQWSTQCEFEADATAGSMGLAGSLATGLLKLHAVEVAWGSALERLRRERQRIAPDAPHDFWQWVVELAQQMQPSELMAAVDVRQRRVLGVHRVTHPPLADRLTALGISAPTAFDWTSPCAGESLFGDRWQEMYAQFASHTQLTMATAWRVEHHRLAWSAVLASSAPGLAALEAAEHLHRSQQSIDALAAAAAGSADAAVKFAHGMALWRREDDRCKLELRASYELDRTFAPAATRLIAAHEHEFGSFEQSRAAADTADAAAMWAAPFTENFRDRLFNETLRAHPAEFVAFAREALCHEDRLDACWGIRLNSRTIKGRSFSISVFVFRIIPDSASATAPVVSEDDLVGEYARLLTVALPANELVRCATFYTTEPIDPKLLRRFDECAGSVIIAPRAPMNVDMIKFDQG